MNIIYIDPGSISTGYAYRVGSHILGGFITCAKKEAVSERLRTIRLAISELIQGTSTPVFDKAVIEIPVAHDYARNVGRKSRQVTTSSIMILSRAVGVLEECCEAHGIPVEEIKATEWTKGLLKQYRIPAASQIAGRQIYQPDEADAICLLDWHERRRI